MADFTAVLKKTIDGLGDNTPEIRQKVYAKARATISAKLAAVNPPLAPAALDKQKRALEEAIASVEADYAGGFDDLDFTDDLESAIASLEAAARKPLPGEMRPAPRPASPPPPPARPSTPPPAERPAPVQASPAPPRVFPASQANVAPRPALSEIAAARPSMPRANLLPEPAPVQARVPERDLHIEDDFEADHAERQNDWQGDRQVDREGDQQADLGVDWHNAGQDDRNDIFGDEPRERRGAGGLIAAAIALLLLGGGGYAAYAYQDEITEAVAAVWPRAAEPAATPETALAPAEPEAQAEPAPEVAAIAPAEETTDEEAAVAAAESAEPPKFTQRLNADGSETDAGPVGDPDTIGEGTTVAALTELPPPATVETPEPVTPEVAVEPAAPAVEPASPPATPAPEIAVVAPDAPDEIEPPATPLPDPALATPPAEIEAAAPAGAAPAIADTAIADPAVAEPAPAVAAATPPAAEPTLAIGQKALFYEERTSSEQQSAETGSIVWSLVQESPGGDLPPEPAIRAEADVPGKDLKLRMTIRRNGDKTLPASHIVEMIFLTPDNFAGGAIDNVLRITFKETEQAAGTPLIGIPARIADGYFLMALADGKSELDSNTALLRNQKWLDIPIVYKSGRRALMSMEKGLPGEKVFTDALRAWQSSTAG